MGWAQNNHEPNTAKTRDTAKTRSQPLEKFNSMHTITMQHIMETMKNPGYKQQFQAPIKQNKGPRNYELAIKLQQTLSMNSRSSAQNFCVALCTTMLSVQYTMRKAGC